MIKTIKKVILSLLSVIGISCLLWIVLILNPNLSYANQTQLDKVTIFHNNELEEETEVIIKDVIEILKKSELYDQNLNIQLCFNDDKIYPNLNPFAFGHPLAYSMFNKTIIKNSEIKFNENVAQVQREANNELQKYNLTWLLAHEFTHNLQHKANLNYVLRTSLGKINWKLEGHADYIARGFKNDGKLKDKIEKYLIEENNVRNGLPGIKDEVGTYLIYGYYKYALIVQYLMEIKKMNFNQICELDTNINEIYSEMLVWRNN